MLPPRYIFNSLTFSHNCLLNYNLPAAICAIICIGVLSIWHFNGFRKILCQCIRIFRWSARKGRSRWPPELVELVRHIIDIYIVPLTLFVIVRYFPVMSNVLKVWLKGVRWQVWGAGGRRCGLVLTYRAASCNFCSNFNCDNVNICMIPDIQTFPAWYTESQKPMQAGLIIKIILVTDDNDNQSGSLY